MTQMKAPRKKEEIDDERLTSCGIGSWRPKCLQRFATPVWFLACMSIVGVVQSSSGSLFFASISTIEKRYAFDSKISAIILIADNFSQMMVSPLVGYLGVRYNRAHLIGIGELFIVLSCFICASPYFIYGPAHQSINFVPTLLTQSSHMTGNTMQFCQTNASLHREEFNDDMTCIDTSQNTVWFAVFLLISGHFCRGIGMSVFFIIGLPYLDDNSSKKNTPMFMGILQSIRLLGPASSFMLTSYCLSHFEDPLIDPGFGRTDPRFVGAWWLPFIILGSLQFIVTLPIFMFPFQFKGASEKASDFKEQMKQKGGGWSALKRFVKNPVVVLYTWGNIFRFTGLAGYFLFKTKYIESQFRQSSSSASFLTGTTSILPIVFGILLGTFLLTRFRPPPRWILILVFLVESVSIFTIGTGMFLGCSPINMATGPGPEKFSLGTDCNINCGCDNSVYTPFCGPDGKTTYFSPCHAGCQSYSADNQTAWDCSCFEGVATKGYCAVDQSSCNNLMYYLGVIMIGSVVASTARTANSLISFRTVEPMDKGFTIGCVETLMAIFSFIPYPVLFGSVVESTCLVFKKSCGKTGNCWLYDQTKLRQYLHGTSLIFLVLGSVFDFLLIFFSDRVKDFYGEEEEAAKKAQESNDLEMKSPKAVLE